MELNRRNTTGLKDIELDVILKVLSDSFGLSWLQKNDEHPLQKLWQRNDELSTNELFTLADSIKTLLIIDSDWTNQQIKIAKGSDRNNSRGSIFELIALNILHSKEHPVEPAKRNQAGYDCTLSSSSGQTMRVSIKSYGQSKFEQIFEKKSKELETAIILLLKKYNYFPVQILIDFPEYPDEKEWNLIFEYLDRIFKSKRNAEDPFFAIVLPINPNQKLSEENSKIIFTMFVAHQGKTQNVFHEKYHSYSLMISSAYHKNEQCNLFSKLDEACANLLKHSADEEEHMNSLFIHLPNTVSLALCETWLDEYFNIYPNKPISLIFFYQPTVVTDLKTNQSNINNAFRVYNREHLKLMEHFSFTAPVGRLSTESADFFMVADTPDGGAQKFPFTDKYIYQHGEHYLKMISDGERGFKGNITKIGSGIFTSLVVEFPETKESAVISGKFPPSDELLIL